MDAKQITREKWRGKARGKAFDLATVGAQGAGRKPIGGQSMQNGSVKSDAPSVRRINVQRVTIP